MKTIAYLLLGAGLIVGSGLAIDDGSTSSILFLVVAWSAVFGFLFRERLIDVYLKVRRDPDEPDEPVPPAP